MAELPQGSATHGNILGYFSLTGWAMIFRKMTAVNMQIFVVGRVLRTGQSAQSLNIFEPV